MGRASKRRRVRRERDDSGVPSKKISACLIEVMQPYREECKSREAYRKLVALASAAWNLSLFSPNERESARDRVLQIFPAEDRSYMEGILQRLVDRKEELFPHDGRFVASADVLDEGTHFRVVAAALSAGPS